MPWIAAAVRRTPGVPFAPSQAGDELPHRTGRRGMVRYLPTRGQIAARLRRSALAFCGCCPSCSHVSPWGAFSHRPSANRRRASFLPYRPIPSQIAASRSENDCEWWKSDSIDSRTRIRNTPGRIGPSVGNWMRSRNRQIGRTPRATFDFRAGNCRRKKKWTSSRRPIGPPIPRIPRQRTGTS